MTAAGPTPLGQRVEQVWQDAQYQMERSANTCSTFFNCSNLMVRFGGCSMKLHIGQPAEHLPH